MRSFNSSDWGRSRDATAYQEIINDILEEWAWAYFLNYGCQCSLRDQNKAIRPGLSLLSLMTEFGFDFLVYLSLKFLS
jgi:hypothetical protein